MVKKLKEQEINPQEKEQKVIKKKKLYSKSKNSKKNKSDENIEGFKENDQYQQENYQYEDDINQYQDENDQYQDENDQYLDENNQYQNENYLQEEPQNNYQNPDGTESFRVKVTGLSYLATEQQIKDLFETFCDVIDCKLVMHKDNKQSKGLAFLNLKNEESLFKALDNNKIQHMGRYLVIQRHMEKPKHLQRSQTIFVGNLSFNINENTLNNQFEKFGTIKSIRLGRDAKGNSRGFAHIDFDNPDYAEQALQMNQSKIGNRIIKVDLTEVQQNKFKGRSNSKKQHVNKKSNLF